MKNNRQKGNNAEKMAIDFLIKNDYIILETNYQTRFGEIDIIAKQKTYVIFIEVKYRKNIKKGYPREAVSLTKQNKIKMVALEYIYKNNLNNTDFLFDVIEILDKNITHIKNAFF